jgi:hypothetical protein
MDCPSQTQHFRVMSDRESPVEFDGLTVAPYVKTFSNNGKTEVRH